MQMSLALLICMFYQCSMARLSDLVRVVADLTGVGLASTTVVARVLREQGLISTNGRGRNAAKMGSRDAASLLLGVVTLGDSTKAAEAVTELAASPLQYGGAAFGDNRRPVYGDDVGSILGMAEAPLGPTFTRLLTAVANRPLWPVAATKPIAQATNVRWNPHNGDTTPLAVSLSARRGGADWEVGLDVELANGTQLSLTYEAPKSAPEEPFRALTRMRQINSLSSTCINAVVRCLRGHPDYDPATDKADS